MNLQAAVARARTSWNALAPREQRALRWAGAIVTAALCWQVLLAGALHTLRSVPEQQGELRRQLHAMQKLQAQAQALRSLPRPSQDSRLQALELSLKPLGASAQLELRAGQALVTLRQLPAASLAQWLRDLERQSRLHPAQTRLQRHPQTSAWNGTLSFTLAATPQDKR